MKPLVPRIFLLSAAVVFATLLIGAATMLGRGIDAKFVLAEIREQVPNAVTYGIVDLDRSILARRVIDVPGYASTSLVQFPPLVLQSVWESWDDKTINWTLSSVDAWTGVLTPEVSIQTDNRTHFEAVFFRQFADGHWTYQDPSDTTLYYTLGGSSEATSIETAAPSGTNLSNDGTRFAIDMIGVIFITDMKTGETNAVEHHVSTSASLRWSPDDRYITVFTWGNIDGLMQVIDMERLETVAEFQGRGLRWCGERLVYTANPSEDMFEARLYDLKTGAEEVLFTRDLSDLALTQRNLTVAALDIQSCDWLLVSAGNALTELMHRGSGRTIPLGYSPLGGPLRIVDGAVMVLMSSPQLTELRRVVLDPSTESYEVLISLTRLSTSITWVDEARGGLYLRNDQLVRIAPVTNAETVLPFEDIQWFVVMP